MRDGAPPRARNNTKGRKRVDRAGWLWVVFTIGAAGTQTLRNAMQRHLTERLGTIGATHVRFLFGLPFGLAFLACIWAVAGLKGLQIDASFFLLTLAGALSQIAGTALMLAAMRERSFVVSIAYVKTEPAQLALFGLVFLGDQLGVLGTGAVFVATFGVVLMSLPRGGERGASLRPALIGIASGAMFAASAVGFRGAIVSLGDAPFFVRATFTLALSLTIQTALLTTWLLARDRAVLVEIFRAWRPSLAAGVTGAAASQMWFLAFSLQSAAAVRTVGLVEVLFALVVSRRIFSQRMSARELAGIALMVGGVAALVNA